jgi:hypothetical protein
MFFRVQLHHKHGGFLKHRYPKPWVCPLISKNLDDNLGTPHFFGTPPYIPSAFNAHEEWMDLSGGTLWFESRVHGKGHRSPRAWAARERLASKP